MKSLNLQFVGGLTGTFDVDDDAAQQVVTALVTQQPAHPIQRGEDVVAYINMRQVTVLQVKNIPDPQTEPEVSAEASQSDSAEQPTVKMIPDPDPQADPDRTVAQLKEALDKAGVEYPSGALKAELQALAREHGV